MKRILLPFFLFTSTVYAHPQPILVRHPQAEVNYYCQPGQLIDQCIATACSLATPYGCRVMSQNQGVYFIETYIPPTYVSPVVVIPPPVFYTPPVFVAPFIQVIPFVSLFPQQQIVQQITPPHSHREVRHRPRRR
jgi:hypothetical protein